jgi:GntR family transcriptional regulator
MRHPMRACFSSEQKGVVRMRPPHERRPKVLPPPEAFRSRRPVLNNSVRRAYDLLRPYLVRIGPDAHLGEDELAERLSASRTTVRAVLHLMVEHGLVTRKQRVGTKAHELTVMPMDELRTVSEYSSYPNTDGRVLETSVLEAPPLLRERLGLEPGARVLMIDGLLVRGPTPLGLSVAYIALAEGDPEDLRVTSPDVIPVIEDQLGRTIGYSTQMIGALAADRQTAILLRVKEGSPLIWFEDVLRDPDGKAIALNQFRMRSDRVVYSAVGHRLLISD